MSNYNTERLRSLIDESGGLASPNRFMVELPDVSGMISPNAFSATPQGPMINKDLPILCTSAQIPGKQLNVMSREVGIQTKSVANGQVFTAVNLSFYLTNKYEIRNYFQYWMDCVVSQKDNDRMYAGYYNNYVRPVTIHQLARGKDTMADSIYSVELLEAFPTQMELIQLNNQAQTTAMEMTIALAYKTYKVLDKKKQT
jgi:hypothetical protein